MRRRIATVLITAVLTTTTLLGTTTSSASTYCPVFFGGLIADLSEKANLEYLQPIPTGRALYRGKKGEDVKLLQIALTAFNYYSGDIDSSFGPLCQKAVKSYQKDRGLSIDGSAGPITLNKLNSDIYAYNAEITEARNALKTNNDSEKDEEDTEAFPSESEINKYFSTMFDKMFVKGVEKPTGFKTPYKTQKSGANVGSYNYTGYCGLYVANRLLCSGVYKDKLDVNCNGKEWYNKLYNLFSDGKTSGGYSCTFYGNTDKKSISSLLEEIGDDGYTGKILLSFPKQSNGSTKYGHVVLIDYLNNENSAVYWSDSYKFNSVPQGWQHSESIAEFERLYKKYGTPSAVVFVK